MDNKIIYELYYTDEWCSIKSLNIRNRIIATQDLELLSRTAYEILSEKPEDFEINKEDLGEPFDIIEKIINGEIKYLYFEKVELDEINN